MAPIEFLRSSRGDLSTMPIERLEDQLRRFLKPANMFVLPKEFGGGLGEIEIIVRAIRSKNP